MIRTAFPLELYQFLTKFIPANTEEHSRLELDATRIKLLAELKDKKNRYLTKLYQLVPSTYRDDEGHSTWPNKLFLRLFAADYLINRIESGDELKADDVKKDMLERFGDLPFNGLYLEVTKGWLDYFVTKLNLPSLPKISNTGMFASNNKMKIEKFPAVVAIDKALSP